MLEEGGKAAVTGIELPYLLSKICITVFPSTIFANIEKPLLCSSLWDKVASDLQLR